MNLLVAWDRLNADDVELIRQRTGADSAARIASGGDLVPSAGDLWVYQPSLLATLLVNYSVAADSVRRSGKVVSVPGESRWCSQMAMWGFQLTSLSNVIGMLLAFNRGLHIARTISTAEVWQWEEPYPFRELTEACVGILGFGGDIGRRRQSGWRRLTAV